ncbi:MAG TPA: hypothetical protein VFQ59_00895 [Candidatus Paceibacterota bacterium]|nr:hypothetical protein [Candidatus Paceibacterota bacterium]
MSLFADFLPIWEDGMKLRCRRWGMVIDGENDGTQMIIEHIVQFNQFVDVALSLLAPYFRRECISLDEKLIMSCALYHDNGEIGGDVMEPKKTDEDDLKEYLSFERSIQNLPQRIQNEKEKSFFLQFALKEDTSIFPFYTQGIIQELRTNKAVEAQVFKSLEKFEYLYYPYFVRDRDPDLLPLVISRHMPSYQRYAEKIPGYREVLFTEQLEAWMNSVLAENVLVK